MKSGTVYAAKLKKLYAKLRAAMPKPDIPEPDDPLHRLAVSILGIRAGEERATQAVNRALAEMVDWNEIRVSSAAELHRAIGNAVPDALQRCKLLVRALQAIYDKENRVSLDRLLTLRRRESKEFLDKLDGIDAFAAASVQLWSLGGHAIPVDDRLLDELRKAELVEPSADRAEVQAFLERNVSAADAKAFCILMRDWDASWTGKSRSKKRAAKRKTRSKVGRAARAKS